MTTQSRQPYSPQLSSIGRGLLDRRNFLSSSATALGSIALASLIRDEGLLASNPILPKIDPPSLCAAGTSLCSQGQECHRHLLRWCRQSVGDVDYKPELIKWDDKPLPNGRASPFKDQPAIWLDLNTLFVSEDKLASGQRHDSPPGRTDRRYRICAFIDQ